MVTAVPMIVASTQLYLYFNLLDYIFIVFWISHPSFHEDNVYPVRKYFLSMLPHIVPIENYTCYNWEHARI